MEPTNDPISSPKPWTSPSRQVWSPLSPMDPDPDPIRRYSFDGEVPDMTSPESTSYNQFRDSIPLIDARRHDFSSPTSPTMSFRENFRARGPRTTGISEASAAAPSLKEPFRYNYHKTRRDLWRKGFAEWLLTVALCAAIVGVLVLYQGSRPGEEKRRFLATKNVRSFNALTVGLSLALGFNLASSLKSYASMLRWSLLARRFQDLETFELILGCTGQTNLMKLAWKSFPWRPSPRLWGLGRSGSKVVFVMSIGWLLVNLSAQIAVAALGQFWPAEPSETGVVFSRGNVTVANFEKWVGGYRASEKDIDIWQQAGAANDWGLQAQDYEELPWVPYDKDNETSSRQRVYYKEGEFYEYRFDDRSESGDFSRWTNRYIRASASCERFRVLSFRQNCTWEKEKYYDVPCVHYINKTGVEDRRVVPPYLWSEGSTTYMSEFIEHHKPEPGPCGDNRCNNIDVYQAKGGDVENESFLRCNSTLSEVMEYDSNKRNFVDLSDDAHSKIFMNDTNARIVAGSIGLGANNTLFNTTGWTAVYYNTVLRWSPNETLGDALAERLISRFAIGAVAAFSDHGPRITVPGQTNAPTQAMTIEVEWKWIWSIMGSICLIQLVSLIILLSFGNKAILRDESVWSLARLLAPVVKKIGIEGSIMRGEDIINHPIFQGKKIAYGVRDREKEGKGNVIDILWEHKDELRRTAFNSGVYN